MIRSSLSVVITCKNAAATIAGTIESVLALSDDVVVYDSGSMDETIKIAKRYGVRIFNGQWEGFGKTRNRSLAKTLHDWVLVIDTDERVEPSLQKEIALLSLKNKKQVYAVRLRNYLGEKELKWGDLGNDTRIRLFNKQLVQWDDAIVHERLVLPYRTETIHLRGRITHYYASDIQHYITKHRLYARLTAEKYYTAGKKATWLKRYINPLFVFVRIYFFRLGIVDGATGLQVAKAAAVYTFKKYKLLHKKWKKQVN